VRAKIRLARDDVAGALADTDISVARGREVRDPQLLDYVLLDAACIYLEVGKETAARAVVDELAAHTPDPAAMAQLTFVLSVLDRVEEARNFVGQATLETRWLAAARACVEGDFVRTAEILKEIGSRPLEADVRLRAAEILLSEGRRADADTQLERAIAFWRSVDATRYLRKAEALLAVPT
jgi:hypothetical protein